MRIGIYGGTFDPVHRGHTAMLENAVRAAELDRVIVLPDRIPPHKAADKLVRGEDRLNMCRLAFEGFDNVTVSDWEIRQQGKSYSVLTLRHFHEVYPDDRLYFIMGSDMLLSFHKWYLYEEILSLAAIAAVSRCDDDSPRLEAYADSLRAKGAEIIISKAEPFEVSSTDIRQRLTAGGDCTDVMDKKVLEYIKTHKLYK